MRNDYHVQFSSYRQVLPLSFSHISLCLDFKTSYDPCTAFIVTVRTKMLVLSS
jgi:hypothetical protein